MEVRRRGPHLCILANLVACCNLYSGEPLDSEKYPYAWLWSCGAIFSQNAPPAGARGITMSCNGSQNETTTLESITFLETFYGKACDALALKLNPLQEHHKILI